MSGLYRYFVTIVVSCTTIALFGTLVFYPRTQSDPSVGVQTAIDRTYISTVHHGSQMHAFTAMIALSKCYLL